MCSPDTNCSEDTDEPPAATAASCCSSSFTFSCNSLFSENCQQNQNEDVNYQYKQRLNQKLMHETIFEVK